MKVNRGMSKIKVLPENISNKIAAGEVVERPASVVKELLENSLDAESTDITVEVKVGGKDLIRVVDNGTGMSHDDAVLALERHATSKIQSTRDLESITTMGFRGEALPSIASISHLELITRPQDRRRGYKGRGADGLPCGNAHICGQPVFQCASPEEVSENYCYRDESYNQLRYVDRSGLAAALPQADSQ